MRVRVLAGVVLSVSALGACADPVSPTAPQGGRPRLPGAAARAAGLVVESVVEITDADGATLYASSPTHGSVNAVGQVAFLASRDRFGPLETRLWERATGAVRPEGFGPGSLLAVNAAGAAVGEAVVDGGATHAVRWARGAGTTFLPRDPAWRGSRAVSVNDNGDAVGSASFADRPPLAVLWPAGGGYVVLGTLEAPWNSYSNATDVNNRGQVVGRSCQSRFSEDVCRAFLWQSGDGMRNLGVLPGATSSDGSSASAINDAGQVVGTAPRGSTLRAFFWDDASGMRDLGTLAGGAGSAVARDINGAGQVVGYSDVNPNGGGSPQAFVWTEAGGMINLGGLESGFYTGYAQAINDRGLVVGASNRSGTNGSLVPVVWTIAAAAGETLLADGNSGRCLDVLGESREPGAGLIIYDCHGGANQRFSYPAPGQTGEIRVYAGAGTPLCVDAWGAGTENGTRLVVWTCHGGANQQWTRTAAGEFRGLQSGRCVDVLGARA